MMKKLTQTLAFMCLIAASMSCEKDSYIPDEGPIVITHDVTDTEIVFTVGSVNTKAGAPKEVEVVSPTGHRMRVSDMTIEPQLTKGTFVTINTLTDFRAFGFSSGVDIDYDEAISTPNIFHNELVEVPDGFKTPHYWRKGNNSFFAYAPYPTATNGITYSGTEASIGSPKIAYTTPVLASNQPDILAATPILSQPTPTVESNTPIALNFTHKLASMGFEVINAFGCYVTKISLSGLKISGTLVADGRATWVLNNATATIEAGLNSASDAIADEVTYKIAREDLMKLDGRIMVIPQELTTDAKLTVELEGLETKTIIIPLKDYLERIIEGRKYTLIVDAEVPSPPMPIVLDYEPANCFMVRPGDEFTFYAQQIGKTIPEELSRYVDGNTYEEYQFYHVAWDYLDYTFILIKPASVQVKWQTAHGRAEINENPQMLIASDGINFDPHTGACKVTITNPTTIDTPTGTKGGSAHICAYSGANGTGDILWSWHIWVTPDEVDTFNTVSDLIMQDRALGAIATTESYDSWGMLYQWGLPYPTTPSNGTIDKDGEDIEMQIYSYNATSIDKGVRGVGGEFNTKSSAKITVPERVKNPSTIYIHWQNTFVMTMWSLDLKTIFDPCPYGYKVPLFGAFGTMSFTDGVDEGTCWRISDTSLGIFWYDSFFPYSGSRNDGGQINITPSSGALGGANDYNNTWVNKSFREYGYHGTYSKALRLGHTFANPEAEPGLGTNANIRCVAGF